MILVKSLLGVGPIPSHRTSASKWLVRNGIPSRKIPVRGGHADAIALSDLPSEVRLAWLSRELEAHSLDPGIYDDAAHAVFLQASPSRRDRAERKAAIARYLVASENATATLRLIKRACERYGIFDQLWTDNGAAFSGHLVAGGNVRKFRNRGAAQKPEQPPGICKIMGIDLRFHMTGNPKARIAERVFATLSRGIDDSPNSRARMPGTRLGQPLARRCGRCLLPRRFRYSSVKQGVTIRNAAGALRVQMGALTNRFLRMGCGGGSHADPPISNSIMRG